MAEEYGPSPLRSAWRSWRDRAATPEQRAELERALRGARGTGWLILPVGSPSFSVIDTGPVEPQPDIVFDAGAVVPCRVVEIWSLSAPPPPTGD